MRIRALLSLALLTTSSAALAQPSRSPARAAAPTQAAPTQAAPTQAATTQAVPAQAAPTRATVAAASGVAATSMPAGDRGPAQRGAMPGVDPQRALVAAPPPYRPIWIPRGPRQPSVVGVSLGVLQTSREAMNDVDASATMALFARFGMSHRWIFQFDFGRTHNEETSKVYSGTTSLAVALGSSSRFVPMIRGGTGLDMATGTNSGPGVHAEAAFVLEARLAGGLILGADLALGARGGRTRICYYADGPSPFAPGADTCAGPLDSSTYRAAKLTLGIAL